MTTQNSWANQVLDVDVTFNGGTFSVGTDATSGAINISTGAAARVTTIGNITGASSLDLKFGTGDFTLASAIGTIISPTASGEINLQLQPSFMAYVNANVANVTGDGTQYKICDDNNTTVFDQNSDYDDNGVFTAPVNGRYQFNVGCSLLDIVAATKDCGLYITTSQDFFFINRSDMNYGTTLTSGGTLAYLDAADTAHSLIIVSGGTKTLDVEGGSTLTSYFGGFLAN